MFFGKVTEITKVPFIIPQSFQQFKKFPEKKFEVKKSNA